MFERSRGWQQIVLGTALAFAAAGCGSDTATAIDAAVSGGTADAATPPDAPLVMVDAPAPADAAPPDAAPRPDALLLADAAPRPDAGPSNDETTTTAMKIGNPTWELVDWQHIPITLGTLSSQFAESDAAAMQIWPLHEKTANGTFESSTPHAPPYVGEAVAGATAAGYDSGSRFPRAAWIAPKGLLAVATIVPSAGAPTGKSLDFESGPVIPASVFPLTIDGNLFRGNTNVDPDFDTTYPSPTLGHTGEGITGYSHIPLSWGESTVFIPGTTGTYRYEFTITDSTGAGWKVTVPFTVE